MADGSHATWGAYDNRVCMICGRKIALQHGAWIHHDQAGDRSTHLECGSPLTVGEPSPATPTARRTLSAG